MELSNLNIKNDLCISLGANIDSKFGNPIDTLILCRTALEDNIKSWIKEFPNYQNDVDFISKDIFKWSSLYETDPYEVSSNQPNYINTLLVINSALLAKPSTEKAKALLNKLKQLEVNFGRNKKEKDQRWTSRCLDLDIIWWNDLYINDKELTLPHPRFMKRNFVISPLAEVLSRRQTVKKLNHPKWVV